MSTVPAANPNAPTPAEANAAGKQKARSASDRTPTGTPVKDKARLLGALWALAFGCFVALKGNLAPHTMVEWSSPGGPQPPSILDLCPHTKRAGSPQVQEWAGSPQRTQKSNKCTHHLRAISIKIEIISTTINDTTKMARDT